MSQSLSGALDKLAFNRQLRNYYPHEVRPLHPVTGRPADYLSENTDTGELSPRWHRRKLSAAEFLKAPALVWLSVTEAASLLGRTGSAVRGYIARGELPAAKPPRHKPGNRGGPKWMIRGSDLIDFTKGKRGMVPRIDLKAVL